MARTRRNYRKKRYSGRRRRTYRSRGAFRSINRKISSLTRRVAGEVCKFETIPPTFGNNLFQGLNPWTISSNKPLNVIASGVPYIYPINWIYTSINNVIQNPSSTIYVNGNPVPNDNYTISLKNPVYYSTLDNIASSSGGQGEDGGTELQYRLAYIYIRALFNASINNSQNNTDGALRIVIVKDKQPTGGAATWADENAQTNSRGVFIANRIDSMLNPSTVGRFKILYDKTLRFNTTNGYKPFKYYKKFSTVVRNNRRFIPTDSTFPHSTESNYYVNLNDQRNFLETPERSPPVQKNAFYLMMFSDGLTFTYSQDAATPPASFHLFNRVAYYNN
uniref:Capsid protein n=1 Tax=Marmot associated feces virus 3 TaxID=2800898 RepID=A0A7T7IJI4_9VIRU|nr:capsid protein [Marmot associated feces virus 3]